MFLVPAGGLGAGIARSLAEEGASVFAAARTAEVTEAWIGTLPPAVAARVSAVSLDLSDRASVDRLAAALLAKGGVDILVNNSGGPPAGGARAFAPEVWVSTFQTMAAHLFHLTSELVGPMIERGWGRIITIASSGVEQPIPNLALSNGIRTAVVGWSKTLATEVAPFGVTVNVVLPGRIQTDRTAQIDKAMAERQGKSPEEVAAKSVSTIPVGHYGSVGEFAAVVTFLASTRASYVTGTMIRIDGGLIQSL